MPAIRSLFQTSDLLKILASNVRDGLKAAAFPSNLPSKVSEEVRGRINAKVVSGTLTAAVQPEDYLIALEDVCFGDAVHPPGGGHPVRGSSPYILQCRQGAAAHGEWMTSVVTVDHWMSLVPAKEWTRLVKRRSKPVSPVHDPDVGKLLNVGWTDGFKTGEDFRFGNPLAWFTSRDELESYLDGQVEKADTARDYLGLVHREAGVHLMALHFKSSDIETVLSARPTFADAARHRRFMMASAAQPPPFGPEWGQTLDLDRFEAMESLADGARERVCRGFAHKDVGALDLQFTYLGPIMKTRGTAPKAGGARFGTDADFAAKQVDRDEHGYLAAAAQL